MRNGLCVLVIVMALSSRPAFAAAGALPPATAQSESSQVVHAMETMYEAATHDDLALFSTVVEPDFFSFDGGKRFDGNELMALVKSAHAAGKVYVWHVTEPQVELYGDTALITYVNRGSLSEGTEKKDLTWLESAVLRKEGSTWRIRFFHSTRVP